MINEPETKAAKRTTRFQSANYNCPQEELCALSIIEQAVGIRALGRGRESEYLDKDREGPLVPLKREGTSIVGILEHRGAVMSTETVPIVPMLSPCNRLPRNGTKSRISTSSKLAYGTPRF